MGVKISHHSTSAEVPHVTAEKPLVFVMDEPKDDAEPEEQKKKKKKRKSTKGSKFVPNAKNFGSRISIIKFKSSQKVLCGWRCRTESLYHYHTSEI